MITGATISVSLVSIVGSIFLARMLDPKDFGYMALAMVVLSTTSLFSGLGVGKAVVQSKLGKREVAFHGFLMVAPAGALLSLIVYLNSLRFANLFDNAEIAPVLRLMSATVLIDALSRVPDALLQKDMMFGRRSIVKIVSGLVYIGSAVVFASFGFGLWSLAYVFFARSVVNLLFLWTLCPGWYWLLPVRLNVRVAAGLLRYGLKVTVNNILAFFNSTWDKLIVGKVLGATSLGFYSKSYYCASVPVSGFEQVVSNVLFSSYSKIQDDKERLERAYVKSLFLLALITVPMATGIFVVAPELIPPLLGDKWRPVVVPLQILTIMSVVRPLSRATGTLYLSIGRPGLSMRISLVQAFFIFSLTLLLVDKGISGVAVALATAYCVGFFYNMYLLSRVLPGILPKVMRAVSGPALASVLMVSCVQFSKMPVLSMLGEKGMGASSVVLIAIGIIIYTLAISMIQRAAVVEAINLVLSAFGIRTASSKRQHAMNKHKV